MPSEEPFYLPSGPFTLPAQVGYVTGQQLTKVTKGSLLPVRLDGRLSKFKCGDSWVDTLLDLFDVLTGALAGLFQRQGRVVAQMHLDGAVACPTAEQPYLSERTPSLRASNHQAAIADRQAAVGPCLAFADASNCCIAESPGDRSAGR